MIDHNEDLIFHSLVRPAQSIPSDAIAIHGITDIKVANAPSWPDVYKSMRACMHHAGDYPVAIYNAEFDCRMIEQNNEMHALPAADLNSHCVMNAYSAFAGVWLDDERRFKRHKLTSAASAFGVDTSHAHRALDDAKFTLHVMRGIERYKKDALHAST